MRPLHTYYDSSDAFSNVRGIYANKPGFVCASGPSLRHIPQGALEGKPTVCVNASFLKFPESPFFFTGDWSVMFMSFWQDVRHSQCKIATAMIGVHEMDKWSGIYNPSDRMLLWTYKDGLVMNRSDTGLVLGGSSIQSAVHFAYILGMNPIILLGNDCIYEDGKKYFTDFDGQPSSTFILPYLKPPHYVPKKELNSDDQLMVSYHKWEAILKVNPELNLLNGTGVGLDGLIDKVNWENYI